MELEVKHYSVINSENWDSFIYSSSMGWTYFLYDMINVIRNKNYKNESFAVVDENNEIFMIMQLHRTPENTLVSQWGFALKDNLTRKQSRLVKQTFENYIDSYMGKYNIGSFDASLPPLTTQNYPTKHSCVNPLMFYNFIPSIRYTYVVDLSKDNDKMLADCEETTRQAIRKYNKSDLYSIVESNGSEEDCNVYIKLHKETYVRSGASQWILEDTYNRNIFEVLIPSGQAKVYFLKDNTTNEYVASVAILLYKNKTAYYWWGASKNNKEIGINKYLLFNVICKLKDYFNNEGYFETGGAHPYLRSGKFKGLNDFKKCFGTFIHPIFTGHYQILPLPHKVIKVCGIKIKYKSKIKTIIKKSNEANSQNLQKKNGEKNDRQ